MSDHFESTCKIDGELITANCRGGTKLNLERIVKELNSLEETRLKKGRKIAKLQKREEKYQRVISGLMAYIELKVNSELWCDWNE